MYKMSSETKNTIFEKIEICQVFRVPILKYIKILSNVVQSMMLK